MTEKHLLVAAAGTGGHVMPGLAVAREMRRRGWKITWIGTIRGMEGRLVQKDGIDFIPLDFHGVRGKGNVETIIGGIKLILACLKCRWMLHKMKPDVFFTTGGYISVPVGYGAEKNGIRTVLMNCDADLLMSTKMLIRKAWGVACGFAGSARTAAGVRGKLTGNPVRKDIVDIEKPEERLANRSGKLKLLVFGGSLGAKVLNETLPKALALFSEQDRPEVLHQCGVKMVEEVKSLYEKAGVDATVVGFIDDMAKAYRESDLVICRAGATSVAELCAAGAASILVPFVASTTSHQRGNAKYMADNGASVMVEQSQLTPEHLFGLILSMRRDRIMQMAVAARSIARSDAAISVSDLIEEVSEQKKRRY